MKNMNSKYFTIAVYAIAVFAFAIVFLLLGLNLTSFVSLIASFVDKIGSIFYGILFALILLPFVKLLDREYERLFCRKKPRHVLVAVFSLTTTYVVLLSVLFLSVGFIIPAVIDNFTVLYNRLAEFFGADNGFLSVIPALKEWFAETFETQSTVFAEVLDSLEAYIKENFLNVSNAGPLVAKIAAFFGLLFSQLSDIFLGLILSAYILASRRHISGVCGKIVVALFPEKFSVKFVVFFKRLYTNFCSFAASRIAVSFFVSVCVFFLSLIGGIPMYSVIVIILFIGQLVPTLGTLIGILLSSAIVLILDPWRAIFFIPALITLEIVAAHLVMPLLLKKALRPSSGTSAVIVLVGFSLLGPIGAFLSVPVFATLSVEFRTHLTSRLAKKNLPLSTESYENNSLRALLKESEKLSAKEETESASEEVLGEEKAE